MANRTPLVSVTVLAYNHERYIGAALRSVLAQTFADLEVVVVDDGSTDGTPRAIAALNDPRIVSIRQENQGPSGAANRAYRACRGRYIALMSGDDVCHPDRIERQLAEYRRGGRRMLFSAVDFIDDGGRPLDHATFCADTFSTGPLSRAEIYHRFFHRGNFINAITGFTETEVMQQFGLCDPRLLQLQDFDQWIRLLKRFDIHISPQSTLHYRIRGDGRNLSTPNPRQSLRCANEHYFIMRRFFEGLDAELFREAFRGELLRPDCATTAEIACEQAFLFVRSPSAVHRLIGVEKLHELLDDPACAAVLQQRYQFDALAFMKLLTEVEPFCPLRDWRSTLFLDTGNGFSEESACRAEADYSRQHFAIHFDIPAAPLMRQVRWDPCEGRLCRVRIEEIICGDAAGKERAIDLSSLSANGVRAADGTYIFETTDPLFLIPCAGPLARLSIRGSWEVQTLESTLGRFPALMAERETLQRELAARRAEAAELERQLQAILSSGRWRIANKIHSLWRLLKRRRAA